MYQNPPGPIISQQEAIDRGMFGPVYHGTTEERLSSIAEEGFKVFVGEASSGAIQHGYPVSGYHGSIPAPIHHLGFGVYFTTVKNIAKRFGQSPYMYYLDVPQLETINFGSTNTMMKWWIKNGYDPELAKIDRVAATQQLTERLSTIYDAVWFKGKGIRRLLDGDQICVYDPSRIYRIDNTLAKPFDVGSKVRRKSDGMIGTVLKSESLLDIVERYPGAEWAREALLQGAERRLTVRWKRGGTDFQVIDNDVVPYVGRGK